MSVPQRQAQSILTVEHPNGNRMVFAVDSAKIVNTSPAGIRVPDDPVTVTVKDVVTDVVANEIVDLHNAASRPVSNAYKFSAQISTFNNAGGSKTWLLTGCWISRASVEPASSGTSILEFKIIANRVYAGESLPQRAGIDVPDVPDEEDESQLIDQTVVPIIPEIVGRPVNPEDLEEQGEEQ